MNNFQELVKLIWDNAELLRGDYRRHENGQVILPFTVLRRLDCALAPTKKAVLDELPKVQDLPEAAAEYRLNRITKLPFHNVSPYDFARLLNEPNQLAANLLHYINGFSPNIREILEYFAFAEHIKRLDGPGEQNLLYQIVKRFRDIDLHPAFVDNHEMGTVFEELIRVSNEQSNETAGEHFTPREVIRLMVNLLFNEGRDTLRKAGIVRTLYDPACGTGGMLSIAEEHLKDFNADAQLEVFGQELNPEAYAVCKSDMILKGDHANNIKYGNSFTMDGLAGTKFDYMLSNPPFGVEWKKVEKFIKDEHEQKGAAGRFGAGLPRISDGSLLFLQHMISKRKDDEDGTRIAVVFNGSPLFTGGAGSGESKIRRWIIENDWLEAIVALPDELFFNTGISTYIWIVTNRKAKARRGKIQLINAANLFVKMRKSLGKKRNRIGDGKDGTPDHIAEITKIYGDFAPNALCKIFDNADFGYRRITIERPLRLNFQLSRERIGKIFDAALHPTVIKVAVDTLAPQWQETKTFTFDATIYTDRAEFVRRIACLYADAKQKMPTGKALETLLRTLGERDPDADPMTDDAGNILPDADLRDFENVPLKESIETYFEHEVLPHVPDAWINRKVCDEIDNEVGVVGYEIPVTRHFYEYRPLRPLPHIEADIEALEERIQGMLREALA